MNIVVDSSVLVAALVDTDLHGEWAEQVLADGSLHAPELILAEVTNVLRRFERAKIISTPDASAAVAKLFLLDIQLFSFEPFAERVWELRHGITSYDAWYVAVAEALNLPLATLDGRLAGSTGVSCALLMPPQQIE